MTNANLHRFSLLIPVIGSLIFSATAAGAVEIRSCATESNVSAVVAEKLDSVLSAAADQDGPLSAAFGAAPGAVLTVEGPDWRYARAAGVSDPETGALVSCEVPFEVGSNTKMMTAATILQLQEEGALSLDDPLSAYLPDFAARLPNGDVITLRQLANHTSGVFSYTDNAPDGAPGIMDGDISDPDALRRGYEMAELVEFAIEHGEPSFLPGAQGQWSYSNTGYILLGLVIESIEGQPIADVFAKRIFDPLEMNDTVYWTDVPSPELGLPRAFVAIPFDVETTDWNLSQGAAAGAVISTEEDMHVFIRALLAGDLFTDPQTLAVMQDAVATGSPGIPAYGIGLMEKASGAWGHGGQTLGFESEVSFIPEHNTSIVGWGTSSQNIMAVGFTAVSQALVRAGELPNPAIAAAAALREDLVGVDWQLTTIFETQSGEQTSIDADRYSITFLEPGDFQARADCNRLLGSWSLENQELAIEPGPVTRAACPPDSRSEAFIGWLSEATSLQIDGADGLIMTSGSGETLTLMQFEAAQ